MFSDPPVVLSLAVMIFAIFAMVLVYVFGQAIFFGRWHGRFWDYFWELLHSGQRPNPETLKTSVEIYLEKRNDFWSVFGQLYISIFLIAAITVLLLTKTINADAGLPLLSAIVAFGLAKTSDRTRDRELPTERRET
jgi:uncharacterized membrane protein YhaH (DUF805 family)